MCAGRPWSSSGCKAWYRLAGPIARAHPRGARRPRGPSTRDRWRPRWPPYNAAARDPAVHRPSGQPARRAPAARISRSYAMLDLLDRPRLFYTAPVIKLGGLSSRRESASPAPDGPARSTLVPAGRSRGRHGSALRRAVSLATASSPAATPATTPRSYYRVREPGRPSPMPTISMKLHFDAPHAEANHDDVTRKWSDHDDVTCRGWRRGVPPGLSHGA